MNGWKNYETWVAVCWDEPEAWAEEAKELVLALAAKGKDPYRIKDLVKALITEHFNELLDTTAPEASLVRDLLRSAIEDIDVDGFAWKAVEEALQDEEANGDLGIDPYFVAHLLHEAAVYQGRG